MCIHDVVWLNTCWTKGAFVQALNKILGTETLPSFPDRLPSMQTVTAHCASCVTNMRAWKAHGRSSPDSLQAPVPLAEFVFYPVIIINILLSKKYTAQT